MSLVEKFKDSLTRSKSGFTDRLNSLFSSGALNEAFYEGLEEILISGDVGVQTSLKLVGQLREETEQKKINKTEQAKEMLLQKITEMMISDQSALEPVEKPHIILLVGVNGSGKTTSAAKLANFYHKQDKKVLLVAGDTFRAAAVEQLEIWAERAGVNFMKQQAGSDPSALFFDAMNSARARDVDVVIGDTAGRLHNKYNLMDELNKIYRIINRSMPGAPHQTLLVVDATTGQNAIAQAKSFNEALPVTGLFLTKLDGTARGGIVISIQDILDIPVRFIGTGEKMEDLLPFDPAAFTCALLNS
ncbi:MAG: signal recognition particle-docking protein FtsY [Bacillota bacterium]